LRFRATLIGSGKWVYEIEAPMPAVVSQANRAMFMRAPTQLQRARIGPDIRRGAQMYVGRHPAFGLTAMPADYGRLPVTMSPAAHDLQIFINHFRERR
jgi:hypothetical protein